MNPAKQHNRSKEYRVVQNNAGRTVSKQRKLCHLTPGPQNLCWLPGQAWIKLKTLLFVFKYLNNGGPAYLSSLPEPFTTSRPSLRSSAITLHLRETLELKRRGEKAFFVVGLKLRSGLPMLTRRSKTTFAFKSTEDASRENEHSSSFDCPSDQLEAQGVFRKRGPYKINYYYYQYHYHDRHTEIDITKPTLRVKRGTWGAGMNEGERCEGWGG